ncbi:MAG: NUDIX hydrolase [Bacteroidetes bacterium]|nr:NUDIX hydrolase [Bacteroidota bacterium]
MKSENRGTYPDNVFSFCPACGARGFSVQNGFMPGVDGHNRFLCESCGFKFYINSSIGVAAVIIKNDDELLMVRRMKEPRKGTLDLPGGFAAPGERAEDAVRREVLEEVNLVLSACTPWDTSYSNEYEYGGITYFTNDIIYTCEVTDWGSLAVNEPNEAEPVFIKLDEIDIDSIGFDSIRNAVVDLLKKNR